MSHQADVDFDFFDSPRVGDNKSNGGTSGFVGHIPESSKSSESRRKLSNKSPRSPTGKKQTVTPEVLDSDHRDDQIQTRIAIDIPMQQQDEYSDSFSDSTDCSDAGSDGDSDIEYPVERPRSGCKAPTPTSGRRGKRSGSSGGSMHTDSEDDSRKKHRTKKSKYGKSASVGSRDVARGRTVSNRADVRCRSRSAGSTASSDWLSDSEASDVTSVSPLGTPRSSERYDHSGMSHKPPKNPSPGRGSKSSRLEHLLQGNKDTMDLNLLMRAVLEMEQEQSEAPVERKKFVVPPPSGQPSPLSRKNFSFKNEKVSDIDRENNRLMKEIVRNAIQAKEAKQKAKCKSKQASTTQRLTPSAVNRLKEQRRIEAENRAMLRRLQSTKATKSIKHDDQLKEYNKRTIFGTPVASMHGSSFKASQSPYGSGQGPSTRAQSQLNYNYDDDAHSDISSQNYHGVSRVRSKCAINMSRPRPSSATSVASTASSSSRPGSRRKHTPKPAWDDKW